LSAIAPTSARSPSSVPAGPIDRACHVRRDLTLARTKGARVRGGDVDHYGDRPLLACQLLLTDHSLGRHDQFPAPRDDRDLVRQEAGAGEAAAVVAWRALDEENTVISYALQEEIYLDLVLGRLDLGLGNGLTMRTGFLNTQLGVGFEAVGPQLDDPAYFGRGEAVALRKAQPELRAAINAAIERLLSDGGLAEIWSRYFDIPPDTALAGAS
jgi:Bacterial extracellular solute-binding proteins, family 3